MRIVVDTNIIASAIFFGGKPYQLLHYIMEDRVDVVASKEIVDEYEEIVIRLKQKYPRINTKIPLHELLSKVTMFVIQMKNALRGLSAPAAWQTPEKFFI